MTTTPGYLSNSELAARISALVDRWNTRENQMIALLTQPAGDVIVTDGVGTDHVLPSFPQLQSEVTALTDDLVGAVAQAQDINSTTLALKNAASASAAAAGDSATAAAGSAASADENALDAAASATSASASAAASSSSESSSASSAAAAADSADVSQTSASEAANQAGIASQAKLAAESARDTAELWAEAPTGTEVEPGHYSARHWADQARTSATGSLIYRGMWDASSGTYPPNPVLGHFYRVGGAGAVEDTSFFSGDQIVYNGSGWDKIDNTESVTTVAGKTGNVVLTSADVGGLGVLATRSDADWTTQVSGKPVSYPPSAHSHSYASLSGKPAAYPPETHGHVVSDVSGLQDVLDSKAPVASPAFTGVVGLDHPDAGQVELGFRSIPLNVLNASYNLTVGDVGRAVVRGSGSGYFGFVRDRFSPGDVVCIINNTGSNLSLTPGSGVTIHKAGTAEIGGQYVLPYGVATIIWLSTDKCMVSGTLS